MSDGDLWGIVIGVAGILIGAGLAIHYGIKQSKPHKRQLLWDFAATPLFSPEDQDFRTAVVVSVDGYKLDNPYLTTLTVKNIGKYDLRSDLFDQGRPLEFRVSSTDAVTSDIASQLLSSPPSATKEGDLVRFGPDLLPSGGSWTVRIVTEGSPGVGLVSCHLADTEVYEPDYVERQAKRKERMGLILFLVTGGVGATIGFLANFLA